LIEQSDRLIDGARTEVHISLRRREILMTYQFLSSPDRRASHRQVRTERMPQNMRAVVPQTGPTCHAREQIDQVVFRHRRSVFGKQIPWPPAFYFNEQALGDSEQRLGKDPPVRA